MNESSFTNDVLSVRLTAHRDPSESLIFVRLEASELEHDGDAPIRVALVIDHSGSMGGEKLRIAKDAAARFVRTLRLQDEVSVWGFESRVTEFCPIAPPSEGVAAMVERIQPGGSTNLHGGWLGAAQSLRSGGRIILLSDGQANAGEFTDAGALGRESMKRLRDFETVTSTIGVGADYDEDLMSRMGTDGGGAHYYAHSPEAITEAFSQERFAMGATALRGVTLLLDGKEHSLGSLFSGEAKTAVFDVDALPQEASIRYTTRSGEVVEAALELPSEFGFSNEAKAESLARKVSEFEGRAVQIRSKETAEAFAAEARALLIAAMNHPLAKDARLASVIAMLEASLARLESLVQNWDEHHASMHRKRSMQASFNVTDSGKSYSSFPEDRTAIAYARAASYAGAVGGWAVDASAFDLLPRAEWIRLVAAPIRVSRVTIDVVVENPLSGFVADEIGKLTGRKVKLASQGATPAEIVAAIKSA